MEFTKKTANEADVEVQAQAHTRVFSPKLFTELLPGPARHLSRCSTDGVNETEITPAPWDGHQYRREDTPLGQVRKSLLPFINTTFLTGRCSERTWVSRSSPYTCSLVSASTADSGLNHRCWARRLQAPLLPLFLHVSLGFYSKPQGPPLPIHRLLQEPLRSVRTRGYCIVQVVLRSYRDLPCVHTA